MQKEIIVSVRTCATSANLGPGFDRLGLALNIYNHYRARYGIGSAPKGEKSLTVKALDLTLDACGIKKREPLAVDTEERIEQGKGLGSSAADILAGIFIADKIYKLGLGRQDMFEIALGMEKHPDNLAAALAGGLVLCYRNGKKFHFSRISIYPHIKVLLLMPLQKINTEMARKSIPDKIPVSKAVDNSASLCMLIDCLREGNLAEASQFIKDDIYQEHRRKIYPASMEAVDCLIHKFGTAAAVSGSGPAVIALADKSFDACRLEGLFPAFRVIETEINFDGSR